MDAVDAADAILVDELDGILDAGFLEGRLLGSDGLLGLVRSERIREDPVLGDDLAQVAGHHAAVAGERHVDGGGGVEDGHDTHIDRHPDAGGADGVHPVTELVHIPAELGHDVVCALILLLLQEGDVGFQRTAGNVALGGACDSDGELVAELLADELHQLGGIVQVAVRAGPAKGDVAAEREHVVDTVVQIGLELVLDAFLGVGHAGEVRHGGALAVGLDLLQDLKVLADVRAASAVGAGDVIRIERIELLKHAALAAQLLHANVRLRGEDFKGKCVALFHDLCYIHGVCLLLLWYLCANEARACAQYTHSDTNLSYHKRVRFSSAFP